MDEIGIRNPEYEFKRWLEERESILKMNRELNVKNVRSGARERALLAPAAGVEE